MLERIQKAIEQSQAIIDIMQDAESKNKAIELLNMIRILHSKIKAKNGPWPPDLVVVVDLALKSIEELYNKKVSN